MVGRSDPAGAGVPLPGFDEVQARLDALLAGADRSERERGPESEPEPEPEPEPRLDPDLDPDLDDEPAILSEGSPGPPRPSRRLLPIVVGAVAAVLLVLLISVVVVGSSGGSTGGAAPVGTVIADGSGAGAVRFPPAVSDPAPPEPRVRPTGLRSVELGLEVALVGVVDLPTCDGPAFADDRAYWYDPGDRQEVAAVAPGEHGVAVIVGDASLAAVAVSAAPLAGITDAVEGTLIEVARVDGVVLRWRVLEVLRAPVGTPFPSRVLAPAPEQRLLLLGCGASVDGGADGARAADVYVLARRDG